MVDHDPDANVRGELWFLAKLHLWALAAVLLLSAFGCHIAPYDPY